jgi:hypothetical protein
MNQFEISVVPMNELTQAAVNRNRNAISHLFFRKGVLKPDIALENGIKVVFIKSRLSKFFESLAI